MANFLNLADMFDGGGAGAVGDTFQGGPFSGLLNNLGIRPMGYRQRQGLLGVQDVSAPLPVPSAPAGVLSAQPGDDFERARRTQPQAPLAAPQLPGRPVGMDVLPSMATPAMPGEVPAPAPMAAPDSGIDQFRADLGEWINQNYPGFASIPAEAQRAIVQAYMMGIR